MLLNTYICLLNLQCTLSYIGPSGIIGPTGPIGPIGPIGLIGPIGRIDRIWQRYVSRQSGRN